jgi:hypothetical protein
LGVLDSRVEIGFSELKTEIIGLRFGLQSFQGSSDVENLLQEERDLEKTKSNHIQEYFSSAEAVISNASEYYESVSGTIRGAATNRGSVVYFDGDKRQRVEEWVPGEPIFEGIDFPLGNY